MKSTCKCGKLTADHKLEMVNTLLCRPVWSNVQGSFYLDYTSLICVFCFTPCWHR